MKDGPLRQSFLPYLEPIVASFGLEQRWNLFAPELTQVNQYSTCLITFEDGSVRLYEWPRVDKSSLIDKFFKQKVRRFVVEFWSKPQYREYWPASADFFYAANKNEENPPKRVEFVFNYTKIPEFSEYTKRQNLPGFYEKDTVFNIPSKYIESR